MEYLDENVHMKLEWGKKGKFFCGNYSILLRIQIMVFC